MRISGLLSGGVFGRCLLFAGAILGTTAGAEAQRFVPGTGTRVTQVGDDFEDTKWTWVPNLPKASSNIDEQPRYPGGTSTNDRVYESAFRGAPDIIQRVETPEGGIPGSTGALRMRTLYTGIPGRLTNEMQQDDLLLNVTSRLNGFVPVGWMPSCVCRVYLPPFEQWEKRTGSSFGFRADCQAWTYKRSKTFFTRSSSQELESYWPGFFIQFNSKTDGVNKEDSALLLIRSDQYGQDIQGPKITEPGWWTLGMSFSPDGQVHYYASPGVDDLTAKDHLASTFPYGFRCERFHTFFFNIVNHDDGRSWSTPWIVDDPMLYYTRR